MADHTSEYRAVETANQQGFAALPERFERIGQDYVLRVWTPDLPPEKSSRLDNPCPCKFCERHNTITRVLLRGQVEEMAELIRTLEEDYEHIHFDNQYLTAILDGQWPDARQILTRALAKCPPEPC